MVGMESITENVVSVEGRVVNITTLEESLWGNTEELWEVSWSEPNGKPCSFSAYKHAMSYEQLIAHTTSVIQYIDR